MTSTGWTAESVDPSADDLGDDLSDRPIAGAMARALRGRELLSHPFYLRWQAGELAVGELAAYAVQYRGFEAALPALLAAVVDKLEVLGEVEAAATVGQNLSDEVGRPEPHLALFDRFRAALTAAGHAGGDASGETTEIEAGPAAQALVTTYVGLVAEGPVAALAGLAAYETQAAAIATSKGDGLRRWYGLDAAGTEFWDVHASMEADHGEWALDALTLLGADPDEVADAARRGADAWWMLLDEREAEAPATA